MLVKKPLQNSKYNSLNLYEVFCNNLDAKIGQFTGKLIRLGEDNLLQNKPTLQRNLQMAAKLI